jgi:FecR protein
MGRVWKRPVLVLSGLLLAAMYAMPQAYTISAKPGAVNYIEGNAFLNGKPILDKKFKSVFLDANDTLSTDIGRAEVLLTPGVFLRVGENSQVRMISPSLTNTQVEVSRGEVMLEVTGLVKDNSIQIIDHGSSTTIEKNGLYRFTADDPPTAAVLDGKALVAFGDRKINLKKGKQTVLAENLKAEKFDTKKEDSLFAWSNVRSEYEAAASYRVAQTAYNSSVGGWRGFGYNGFSGPGWYWNNGFNSWAWLPGAGAFYSPFGYGFYSPGLVTGAPVIFAPVYSGGIYGPGRGHRGPINGWQGGRVAGGNGIMTHVPVNPNNPAAVGMITASPWANHEARMAAARSMMQSGLRTASGAPVPNYGPAMAPADQGGGWYGRGGMPGGRISGPANMPMGNPSGPASMPAGGPGGSMPGGHAGGPPPSMPAGGGSPGGMPGGHAGGPPH